jgi:hypothetical protein
MSEETPAAATPVVHALLVCRSVEANDRGEVSIQNVVEVAPVDSLPGDAGPLTFVALVRNLPPGPGEGAFLLQAPDTENQGGRLPLRMDVPAGFQDRQVALHVTLPSVPVQAGGWYELYFEWDGVALAANRFAVGVKG